MSQTTEEELMVITGGGGADAARSYVDWGAILAGAFVAWALGFVLTAFGAGLGLSVAGTPWDEGMSPTWFMIAAALYFIWVQVTSVVAGAYLAGRLRRPAADATAHEADVRDGAHGLVVWAVGAVIGAVLALSAAASGIGATASLAGGAASVGAEAVASAAGGDEEDMQGIVARLFAPEAAGDDAQAAGGGQQPGATAAGADRQTARDDVLRVLLRSGLKGELSEEDRRYISQLVANATGMSLQQAAQRVEQYLNQALTELRQATEAARKTGIIGAFLIAATMLISAVGAWWGAGVGGRHRDENVDLSRWFRLR